VGQWWHTAWGGAGSSGVQEVVAHAATVLGRQAIFFPFFRTKFGSIGYNRNRTRNCSVLNSEKNRTVLVFQEPKFSKNRKTKPIGSVITERPGLVAPKIVSRRGKMVKILEIIWYEDNGLMEGW
jgi:hypothetical protein